MKIKYCRVTFRSSLAALLAVAAFPLGHSAVAATRTWENTGSDWNTPGDWFGGVPAAGDTAAFTGAAVDSPNLSAASFASNVTFDATSTGYDITSTGGYSLTLTAAITALNTSGSNTFDAALFLNAASGTQAFSQAAGGTLIVNSAISSANTVGLNVAGGGTVTLAGASTFTGSSTFSSGTLDLNSAGALGVASNTAGPTGVTGTTGLNSALVTSNSSGTLTIDNTSGAAKTITSTGVVTINSGSLNFSTAGGTTANSLTFDGGLTYAGPRTITLNGAGSLTFAGSFYETNTAGYTLATNLGSGTASTSVLTVGGFVLGNSSGTGTRQDGLTGSAPVTISGAVTDGNSYSNSLLDSQAGGVTLSGNNTFTGGITVNNILNINSVTALGIGGTLIINNTAVVLANTSGSAVTQTTTNPITLGASFTLGNVGDTASNNLTFGAGALTAAAGRTITVNGGAAFAFGGVLTNGSASNAGQTTTINNGTGTATNTSVSFGGFQLATGATATTVTSGISGSANVTFTGAITNGGTVASNFTYGGTGVLTLGGASTYTGTTTVTAGGTLLANGGGTTGSATGSGAVSVTAGSILGGTGRIAPTGGNAITVGTTTTGATITGGGIGSVGMLTLVANTTLAGSSANPGIFYVDLNNSTTDALAITGKLTLSGTTEVSLDQLPGTSIAAGTYALATYTSETGGLPTLVGETGNESLSFNSNGTELDLTVTAVPEPSTVMAGIFACGLLAFSQRRRGADLLKGWLGRAPEPGAN